MVSGDTAGQRPAASFFASKTTRRDLISAAIGRFMLGHAEVNGVVYLVVNCARDCRPVHQTEAA